MSFCTFLRISYRLQIKYSHLPREKEFLYAKLYSTKSSFVYYRSHNSKNKIQIIDHLLRWAIVKMNINMQIYAQYTDTISIDSRKK